jgi:2-dehydropantoate 2-reductase
MKICVFGAGAVGGYIGGRLALAGAEVTLIARGPHLAAMRAGGLRLRIDGEDRLARPACTNDPAAAGPQDFVFVTLKAHDLPAAAAAMAPLLGPDTAVVTASNGVPWWYFHGLAGRWQGHSLDTVDPGGAQWREIGPERAIGCVVFAGAQMVEPGTVRHVGGGHRLALGEPDGHDSARLARLIEALQRAGFEATDANPIRDEIWMKLWGNLSFNPVSALTGGLLDEIAADPGTRAVIRAMMVEARAVGEALGVRFDMEVEARIDMAGAIGAHKTSMLQDLERGRRLEIDAILGVVRELGELTGRKTPMIDAILGLVRQRDRTIGRPAG